MPLLGGLLVNLFSGIVAWLATYVTRKVAFAVAAVAAYSTLTLGLYAALRSTLAALDGYSSGVAGIFLDALRMGVPPAAPFCLGLYMTMYTACTVYTWQRDLLFLAAKV